MSNGTEREQWGSKLGFIMAAAGSAVGLGNIWRFPYLAGMNGGAAFVVMYLIIVVVLGSSIMLAEFTLGRRTQLNGVGAFRKISKGGPAVLIGWMGVLAGFFILSYYGVIAGWTIKYMVASFTGLMDAARSGPEGMNKVLGDFIGNWKEVVFYQVVFMLVTIVIVYKGVGAGIERSCKFMMPALFVILFILIARSLTLPGSSAGLAFYMKPDFSKLTGSTLLAATGQAFFSLSLAMGIMTVYGSYIKKEEHLPSSVVMVAGLDSAVAILAGFAIFPGLFAFGMEPTAGVALTFVTCPLVFSKIAGGSIFSALFFVLFFFAALTSAISLLEVSCAYAMDEMKWTRAKASWIIGGIITVLGIPSAMSFGGAVPEIVIGGKGKIVFDAVDYLTNNIMLPFGGILICLYVGWFWFDEAKQEATNEGQFPFPLAEVWKWILRVVAPVALAIVLITGAKW